MYMTKEEFKSKKEIINSKIRELNNEMIKLIIKREFPCLQAGEILRFRIG